jgi:oxaloacetate decarboxylase alpha subunit
VPEAYRVTVDGHAYDVLVAPGGEVTQAVPVAAAASTVAAPPVGNARTVPAPLAGNIFKINVAAGQVVQSGDVVMILEAMKMETEVRAPEEWNRAICFGQGGRCGAGRRRPADAELSLMFEDGFWRCGSRWGLPIWSGVSC